MNVKKFSLYTIYGMVLIFLVGFIGMQLDIRYNGMKLNVGHFNSCDLELLNDTVDCLVNRTRADYSFRDTWDYEDLTERELLLYGGDCKDWSFYYQKELEKKGFKTKIIRYYNSWDSGHQVTLVHDTQGYCIIDQINYECFQVGEGWQ